MALDQAHLAAQQAEDVSSELSALKAVYDARITALEARLTPRATLTEEQAARIGDLVKQAALALAARAGGGNFFGTVYGQLYRTFNVTSYKLLTQAQYPQAIAWLEAQITPHER
jgi:hypothetical protein